MQTDERKDKGVRNEHVFLDALASPLVPGINTCQRAGCLREAQKERDLGEISSRVASGHQPYES